MYLVDVYLGWWSALQARSSHEGGDRPVGYVHPCLLCVWGQQGTTLTVIIAIVCSGSDWIIKSNNVALLEFFAFIHFSDFSVLTFSEGAIKAPQW